MFVPVTDNQPAFAVVPYGKWPRRNLADMSLDDLLWPLGRPERLMSGTLRDLCTEDHLITHPRKPAFFFPRFGVKAKVSVMIVEPDVVHGFYLKVAPLLGWRFHKVMSKNAALLKKLKNGLFFYYGATSIEAPEKTDTTKHKMASLIASKLNQHEGHKLRHVIVDHIRSKELDVDVMGRGYKPFENKEDGLAPYRYSVIIENSRESDYFTEKVVDACLCETVPIYWGAPNIADYFDTRGMIICTSEAEINAALEHMNIEDYAARLEYIKRNKQFAFNYADYIERAARTIRDDLAGN